jgi:uncharacterized damage-inducible protein DinB
MGELRLEPIAGYAPTIGRLVGMLTYTRQTVLAAVAGLTVPQLDHLHDERSNSIGALLAHAAAVERAYQVMTFDERAPSPVEEAEWKAALELGAEGRRLLRGKPLDHYLTELESVRRCTLEELARRDDEWLEAPLRFIPAMNAHWAWFHVAEDALNHRGQIRWLRARLPNGS